MIYLYKEHIQVEAHENKEIQDHEDVGCIGNGREDVEITINDVKYTVHRGHTMVADIKSLANVNPAWVLYLFGQSEPLNDEGFVVIKGGEIFLSSARSGQSS